MTEAGPGMAHRRRNRLIPAAFPPLRPCAGAASRRASEVGDHAFCLFADQMMRMMRATPTHPNQEGSVEGIWGSGFAAAATW